MDVVSFVHTTLFHVLFLWSSGAEITTKHGFPTEALTCGSACSQISGMYDFPFVSLP